MKKIKLHQILLIDNFDSFTYNLVHTIESTDLAKVTVKRNDDLSIIDDLDSGKFDGIVVSPGPGSPLDESYFGICGKVILDYGTNGLPILGICLGMQGISTTFGGHLKKLVAPMHGKTSVIKHNNDELFKGIPPTFTAMRYHSLIIDDQKKLPASIKVIAEVQQTEPSVKINGKEIMAIRHIDFPIFGLQFHPESFASEYGTKIIENFILNNKKYD